MTRVNSNNSEHVSIDERPRRHAHHHDVSSGVVRGARNAANGVDRSDIVAEVSRNDDREALIEIDLTIDQNERRWHIVYTIVLYYCFISVVRQQKYTKSSAYFFLLIFPYKTLQRFHSQNILPYISHFF